MYVEQPADAFQISEQDVYLRQKLTQQVLIMYSLKEGTLQHTNRAKPSTGQDTLTLTRNTLYLLEGRAAPLHITTVHLQHLLRPTAHPSAERLDGGPIYRPLSHPKLPEVCSSVTSQSLTVLKVESAQLTTGIGW